MIGQTNRKTRSRKLGRTLRNNMPDATGFVECSAWPPGGEALETQGGYSYQQGSNKLANINAATPINFGYDPNGNITSENTRTMVYDLSNQLIQVWNGGTQIAAYTYNGVGQRMMKVTQTGTESFITTPGVI